ncbi:motility associated factor glycosyltransferase family protein, partial [Campylobacter jejuni]|nr:motility associated factor glycosyltransferase family protein [Campylobacter jejuni]
KCKNELKKLDFELKKSEKNIHTLKKIKQNLLKLFKEFKSLKLYNELTQALYYHNECDILKYQVLNENKQKISLIDFLTTQKNWFIQGLGYLEKQNEIIKNCIENWKNKEIFNDF